jgi:serine/threonine-protein kinase
VENRTAKYQYRRRLGGGGMAEVFLAATVGAEGFTRPVAIKRVLPSFSEDTNFSTMFVNEARISSILRHPNIVQVLDFDRDFEGRLFLVMELVEGKDLDEVAKQGPLPVPVVVYVIIEALRGLAHAHEMTTSAGKPLGIVHRDISPHNVLVSWDGAVKVSDFGIAKAMQASGIAHSGMIKGKPMYMAPEQVTSPDALDQRADLFAVGVMLYELLTGQHVYRGATHEEVLTDIIQVARGWRPLVAPTVTRPDLPRDVAQVAMRLLAPDRDQRFASARDAIDALLATSSTTSRGGEMLSALLFERFPADAPPRMARRSAQGSRVGGGAVAPWMANTVSPSLPPTSGTPPDQVDGANVPVAGVRTVETTPGRPVRTPPVSTEALAAAPHQALRRDSRAWIYAIAVLLAVGAAVVIVVMATSGSGADTRSEAPADGRARATAPIDAGTEQSTSPSIPIDAAVLVAPVDAAPVPAITPDAGTKKRPKKHPPKGEGSGSGSGTTIHEIKIDDDGG